MTIVILQNLKEIKMKKTGIILENGCCKCDKDYRIFDYKKMIYHNSFILLSQQGYRTIKDALQDAKIMGISITRKEL